MRDFRGRRNGTRDWRMWGLEYKLLYKLDCHCPDTADFLCDLPLPEASLCQCTHLPSPGGAHRLSRWEAGRSCDPLETQCLLLKLREAQAHTKRKGSCLTPCKLSFSFLTSHSTFKKIYFETVLDVLFLSINTLAFSFNQMSFKKKHNYYVES